MFFKWLFTFLAVWWLYQALRPYFRVTSPPAPPPPPEIPKKEAETPPKQLKRPPAGDYIDYEEVE